jgi:SAM-dependent methyltransferase
MAEPSDGRALEFGVGTGRIALPLSRRGIAVHGIELPPAMVARLRAQPGGDAIGITVGDFASVRVDATFGLVYLVRNTITNLTTQDEQVACFQKAAAHLQPGGCFVIEVYIPALRQLPPGQTIRPFTSFTAAGAQPGSDTHLGFAEYDLAAQIAVSHHCWMIAGQIKTSSGSFRYVWPAELDLMAQLAGMRLRERWGGWRREPFTGESTSHVSVWERV